MPEVLDLFTHPNRVSAGLHRNQSPLNIPEALGHATSVGPESTSIDDFTVSVQGAVMAPDVTQIDSNRDPDPRTSAWTL